MISIHRIVFHRLILAWLAVSLFAGGLTYFIEIEKIDDAIVALAASEAEHFAPESLATETRSARGRTCETWAKFQELHRHALLETICR